ncbi:putative reverse transcriptase domain-containing protein [Tanacetum coccineum]|uniref:Reverse transcriptase domain-containing protein n=1 Tax=Tanacetum coccineum TaxID=301880 RepID=A0ABQ5F6T7_9ASTR
MSGSIENIVVCEGHFFGDLLWRLDFLPIRLDGMRLYTEKEAYSYAFMASRTQSWVLQDHILRDSGICGMDDDYVSALVCLRNTNLSFDFSCFTNKDTAPFKAHQTQASTLFSEMVKDMEAHFDIIVRHETVFECIRAPHAQDFLLAIPIDGLGQLMSPVEYRTILKYRLMIPLFPVDAICLVFRKACVDSFGEHAVHCKELPGFKYRHNMVRDVLFDICRRAGISAKKEALVNVLTDPLDKRSTLRPADVLVFGWVGEKHAYVDLTGVSPLVGLSGTGFTVGQAALKAASCKLTKHEKACIENQHVFIPFAFDKLGFLAPKAVELLNRVQQAPDHVTRISKLDISDPLHLHPNDTTSLTVVPIKLKGTKNYQVWSCAMLLDLEGKNNTLLMEHAKGLLQMRFLMFSKRAKHVWKELKETYDKVDGSTMSSLHHQISTLKQNGSFIADYYHKLNALWKQYDAMIELPKCADNAFESFKKHNQLLKLMQFLMGLDDSYMQIRSSILSREVLPDVKSAYATISIEESHRFAVGSIAGSS